MVIVPLHSSQSTYRTMDVTDIDFLEAPLDNTLGDVTLSQICDVIENENIAVEEIEDLSISQTLAMDELNTDMDKMIDMPGNFDLMEVENVIEQLQKAFDSSHSSQYSCVDDASVGTLIKSTENKNTRKNTNWSKATFNDWRGERMMKTNCAIPELLNFTAMDINQWLSKFAIETRRKDGKPFPPRTLYSLCVGLLRCFRENGVRLNFLNASDFRFNEFRLALSARMIELTAQGVGTTTKQAKPISKETEKHLWDKGLFGKTTAKSMTNTMFYYNSKLFGLRGVDEHKHLNTDKFDLGVDQRGKYLNFNGSASKTNKEGGLNQRHVSAKSIKHYFQNDELYEIYEYYFQLVGSLKGNSFYRRPLDSKNGVKFGEQPIGVNKLSSIIKTMCADAGIEGYFTNHSGKHTCVTTLYQAGIPEQENMNRNGHRSVESVIKVNYKRAADDMLKVMSNVLEPEAMPVKKMRCETVTSPSMPSENETVSNIDISCGAHSTLSECVNHVGAQK